MILVFACIGVVFSQPSFEEGDDCLAKSQEGWCARSFTCSDVSTSELVRLVRVRKLPNQTPVDTSVISYVRSVCQLHGMELPSIHTDLENWCVFQAGLHGLKGRVPLGMVINQSLSKGWMWMDGTVTLVVFYLFGENLCLP